MSLVLRPAPPKLDAGVMVWNPSVHLSSVALGAGREHAKVVVRALTRDAFGSAGNRASAHNWSFIPPLRRRAAPANLTRNQFCATRTLNHTSDTEGLEPFGAPEQCSAGGSYAKVVVRALTLDAFVSAGNRASARNWSFIPPLRRSAAPANLARNQFCATRTLNHTSGTDAFAGE